MEASIHVHLAYGKTGLDLHLPGEWDITVVEPKFVPGLPDPQAALRQSLRQPLGCPALREIVSPEATVGIVFNDITRATPNQMLIEAVLAEIPHISPKSITLFNALGTHRPNTGPELRSLLGDELVDKYRIVQNNSFDSSTQVYLGKTSLGHEIWINQELAACGVKILTGFIEPHFFAGFSGAGKAIMPGMAGQATVLGNHSYLNDRPPQRNLGRHPRKPDLGGNPRGGQAFRTTVPAQRHPQP